MSRLPSGEEVFVLDTGRGDNKVGDACKSARIVVVRGDLYSDTGYARATRALHAVLAAQADLTFAVSLHEHGRRRRNTIDCAVVTDAELRENDFFRGALVVNVCLPDQFLRVAGAFNIGYFFWETEVLPPLRFWKAQMRAMDRIWAPSRWQSEYLQEVTGRTEIPVVPWPLAVEPAPARSDQVSLSNARVHPSMTSCELDNYLVRASPDGTRLREKELEAAEHAAGRSARFDPARSPCLAALRQRDGDLFVAIQTDAARKGLPLLLAGWMTFKASSAGRDAKLVIKMSSLDVDADLYRVHFHTSLATRRAARRCRIARPDVWFLHDRLSAGEMRALLRTADAFVTATMGEGFGGPIAESLIEGTPVISPRHTSIGDLLCTSYPLVVASEPHRLALWNNIDVYSAASQWHVVDDASLAHRLEQLTGMSDGRRRDIVRRARGALLAHAGRDAVARALDTELRTCARLQARGATGSASNTVPMGLIASSSAPQAAGRSPC